MHNSSFFRDEKGFTTAGAAIALLLVFALLFASLHAYWVGSHSGEVQYVADSAALAADSVVADFVTAGQAVDATLLSLSLITLTVYAVSAVAAFIPGGQGVSATFLEFGSTLIRARSSFANSATKGLNAAQKSLPLLCAARASEVVESNANSSGINYKGTAIALPLSADGVSLSSGEEVEDAAEQIEAEEDSIQERSRQYQIQQDRMNNAKHESWLADCGNDGMCMYERASKLAGLSGSSNPYYSSDSYWSYSVGLTRAKNYYSKRYFQEAGSSASGSPEAVGESVARKRFYYYAYWQVSSGSVYKENGLEIPDLKTLPRNTQQIKETYLYTEAIYPVSSVDGKTTLHAYAGCPKCSNVSGHASVASIDSGVCSMCDTCKFSATTLGRVPSASTSINNGFEYYYKRFVESAETYKDAARQASSLKSQLDGQRNKIGDILKNALSEVISKRYDPQPPGRYGCIAVVEAPATISSKTSSFFTGASTDGTRVAISGATLAAEDDTDGADVISSVGANLFSAESLGSGISKTILGAWASLLKSYSKGTSGIDSVFKRVAGCISVDGNQMSSQASGAFNDALTCVGLQPADLHAYKPVLVNTEIILKRDDSVASKALCAIKDGASRAGSALAIWKYISTDTGDLEWGTKGIVIGKMILKELGIGSGETDIEIPISQETIHNAMRGVE